jgi:DNA-binding GntR family transcriptional regulator
VLATIERIYAEMRQAAKRGDISGYYELNNDFHLSIVRGTGNRSLVELHEKVMWHVHRERHRANFVEQVTVESAESHDEIVRAIVEQRAEDAGLAMRRHLENVSRLMLATRQAQQDASSPARKNSKPTAAGPADN